MSTVTLDDCRICIPCNADQFKHWDQQSLQTTSNIFPESSLPSNPVHRMQMAYMEAKRRDVKVLAYIHSDVTVHDSDWLPRCLKEFDAPDVGVVGWGGARQLGSDDLYLTPYRQDQLARFGYMSNTTDAEAHGERFEGETDVATLDGFCLIVRRDLLDRMGGWPEDKIKFHNYDNGLCCYAHRLGYRVRLVGVSCTHSGGGHSVKGDWAARCVEDYGMTDLEIHRESHVWMYEEFRDVLPITVGGLR